MAACENQGKQHELSDHWKSIKTFLEKKKKKKWDDEKIDWNTNFNKRFYILQNQI